MRYVLIGIIFGLYHVFYVNAQRNDSIKTVELHDVVVTSNYEMVSKRNSALPVEVAEKKFLSEHFTGNLIQTLEYIPGVRSMDIGSGFSKPMIRGMSFNRIVVVENGIKQEGQQWGSDHGLEIDAFNIERVVVHKGPSSVLYGSDAIGGVMEIPLPLHPSQNQIFGEASLLGKSVNGTWGGSLMLGIKKNSWYTKLRYTEQHYGDYRVPADTIVYLTQQIPVYGNRIKNTAGFERNANFYTEYRGKRYFSNYSVSNVYQKTGFFPGAHGTPDPARAKDDGNARNIELPYSKVNHLKVSSRQQYMWSKLLLSLDLGYQNNHREEWSEFHTHYNNQSPPEIEPDKELLFDLNTYSSSLKIKTILEGNWEYSAGWDMQFQQNRIGGYSFLLPQYDRFVTGVYGLAAWRPTSHLTLSGGLRYDYGTINISAYQDYYLEEYLQQDGYDEETIEEYRWRSYDVQRAFPGFSGSVGAVWNLQNEHLITANIGHSFRLPGANELSANGLHHGAFRYERGDPDLSSERGWQLDVSYVYQHDKITCSVSPFVNWFSNYIYLSPTKEPTLVPHSGQIYRYTGTEALFAGAELSFGFDVLPSLNYSFTGEYIYTYNFDRRIPLSFSPPASMRNTLTWKKNKFKVYAELHSIAAQNRVANNESPTPGANLINLGGSIEITLGKMGNIDIHLSVQNLLNTKYYNHLSFYRKVEIPEPGRNFQILINKPFKIKLK